MTGLRLLMCLVLAIAVSAVASVPHLRAATGSSDTTKNSNGELLEEEQPDTAPPYTLEIVTTPQVEDLVNKGYMRMPFHLRLGLPLDWETQITLNTLVNNPFRPDHESGLADVTFGAKYQWESWLQPYLTSATAFSVQVPTGDHPEVSGEYTHLRPKLIFSRKLLYPKDHRIKLTSSIGLDILYGSPVDKQPPNTLRTTVGATYPYDNVDYVLETAWVTDAVDNGSSHSYFVTPGLMYHLPMEDYPSLPGKWHFGFGVKFGFGDADDKVEYITRIKVDIPLVVRVSLQGVEMEGIIEQSWPAKENDQKK